MPWTKNGTYTPYHRSDEEDEERNEVIAAMLAGVIKSKTPDPRQMKIDYSGCTTATSTIMYTTTTSSYLQAGSFPGWWIKTSFKMEGDMADTKTKTLLQTHGKAYEMQAQVGGYGKVTMEALCYDHLINNGHKAGEQATYDLAVKMSKLMYEYMPSAAFNAQYEEPEEDDDE